MSQDTLVRAAILALTPYAYWPCDDASGSTLTDDSGNGRDATITGTPEAYASTETGVAGGVSMGIEAGTATATYDKGSSSAFTEFSVSFFIRPESLTNYNQQVLCLSNVNNNTTDGWGAFLAHAGSGVSGLWIGLGQSDANGRITPTDKNGYIAVNTWVLVTFTWDGTNGKLYVNGTLQYTKALSYPGTGVWRYAQLFMGHQSTTADGVDGLVQHVAIYDYALDATEVGSIANPLRTYDFENGTLGSTITTTTAPFDDGADPSCDVTYGPGINGNLAMRIDYHAVSGAQDYAHRDMHFSTVATAYARGTFMFTRDLPEAQCSLLSFYETGSYREEVRFNTDGTISIYDYQATARDTSTVAFALGDIFRLEWQRTATTQELRIFHGANLYGTTADEVLTGTSTGSDVNRVWFGSRLSFTNSNTYVCLDIDDIGYDTTTWLGAPTDAGTTGVRYLSKSAYQSSSDPASVAIPEPEGAAVGDVVIVLFAHKEASPTINTPTGWTLIGTEEAGQGANGSSSGGTAKAWAFGKVLDGTESWPESFATDIAGAGYATVIGQGYLFRSRTADAIGFTGSSGDDNTAGTAWSVTTGALTTEPGDQVIVVSAVNDTKSASAPGLAQTGATFGPVEELLDYALWGNNFKVTHVTALADVVTGAASTAITYTMTLSSTSGDSPAGPSVVTVVHLSLAEPQDITGSTSLDFGMTVGGADGELQYRDLQGTTSLDFGMTTGVGGSFSVGAAEITGVTSVEFGMGTNPSGAVEAAVANDSVLYRISPGNAPGPGKISEHPLWRRVDRIPTPYSIVVEDGVARRVRFPSNDLDPDTVYLGGHEYQILDTHEHYAALVAAGITMEEIG